MDYAYIGKFIREISEKKCLEKPIPVSCFTATAKQKVISDIGAYFRDTLGLELKKFLSSSERTNLRYEVIGVHSDSEKDQALRDLVTRKRCPTIVYVSRTKLAEDLAEMLNKHGVKAAAFHGKMDSKEKQQNQDEFKENLIQVMVATSAFGMGVDKEDVGMVIHYDIAGSLEDYVQEAGRAGRKSEIKADCYVLFNPTDLSKHFALLRMSRLTAEEVDQIWRAIKRITKKRDTVYCSALELARKAGWTDENDSILETRAKTAVTALEKVGYIERGKNSTRVFADSLSVDSQIEAEKRISKNMGLTAKQKENAVRVAHFLVSGRSVKLAQGEDPETRVDYIADKLGLEKKEVFEAMASLKQSGVLDNLQDMTAEILEGDSSRSAFNTLKDFQNVEKQLVEMVLAGEKEFSIRDLNQKLTEQGLKSNPKTIQEILHFWATRLYAEKHIRGRTVRLSIPEDDDVRLPLRQRFEQRMTLSDFIIKYLFEKYELERKRFEGGQAELGDELLVSEVKPATEVIAEVEEVIESGRKSKRPSEVIFSAYDLMDAYNNTPTTDHRFKPTVEDVQDALLYLHNIEALKLKGGFLVLYHSMEIKRLDHSFNRGYKGTQHREFEEFYLHRAEQIHIVGEFASYMVKDYDRALQFVRDYFNLAFKTFVRKYFRGREEEIKRAATPDMYARIVKQLSERQQEIIEDDEHDCIVVAAGPGSGKTRVLVHKLAALTVLDEVKNDELVMLTFSRAAALEFREKLGALLESPTANYIEINTFHSYAFNLLCRKGTIKDSENVIKEATKAIKAGEIDTRYLAKTTLVIDEAQDMSRDEFELITALKEANEGRLKIIAVGDDDQAIYGFRGSSSKYLYEMKETYQAKFFELPTNYRSTKKIIGFANDFAKTLPHRLKTQPIEAARKEEGLVKITEHTTKNIHKPLLEEIKATYRLADTAAVLTRTNDEALEMVGLLTENGINAKLLQNTGDFDLINVAELRYFLRQIRLIDTRAECIREDTWEKAMTSMKTKYATSGILDTCIRILESYKETDFDCQRRELETFLKEAKYEDFAKTEEGVVLVSTMHSAKGREFDQVYLMLNPLEGKSNKKETVDQAEERRLLYVAITRAKNELYIHTSTPIMRPFAKSPNVQYVRDDRSYAPVTDIGLYLELTNVFLSFRSDLQHEDNGEWQKSFILGLRSGEPLYLKLVKNWVMLTVKRNGVETPVCALAEKYREGVFKAKLNQGYEFKRAEVGFVMAWKNPERKITRQNPFGEDAIVLPRIYLTRKKSAPDQPTRAVNADEIDYGDEDDWRLHLHNIKNDSL